MEYRRRDAVWRLVEQVQSASRDWPDPPNVYVILVRFLGVCPEGMITADAREYLESEMVCETYKSSPVSGGIEDWPGYLYDAYLTIRRAHQEIRIEKQRELLARTRK